MKLSRDLIGARLEFCFRGAWHSGVVIDFFPGDGGEPLVEVMAHLEDFEGTHILSEIAVRASVLGEGR